MGAVRGAEGVADEGIREIRQFLREALAVLGLVRPAEAGVLQKHDVALLHGGHDGRRFGPGHVVVVHEGDLFAQELLQAHGDRRQGFARVRAVFHFAEVRAEDDLAALFGELFNGRQRGADARVICDHAVL